MINKARAKILSKEFIKQNFNATATIKKLEPKIKPKTAEVKASRMIRSVEFNKSLEETMEELGLNDKLVERIHKRNLKQSKSLPASNEALNIYHKIKGNYAPEKKLTANLNIDVRDKEALNKRIKVLREELKQLDEPRTEKA